MAPWMTQTVVAICDGIDADKAYDRLPVLADAVEDTGCPDEAVAVFLRAEHPLHVKRFYRRVVEGHVAPAAVVEAVGWLTDHGRAIGTDPYGTEDPDEDRSPLRPGDDPFEWVMDSCRQYVDEDQMTYFGYDTPEKAIDDAKQMWDHYEALTGRRPPDEQWTDGAGQVQVYAPAPYRCAC